MRISVSSEFRESLSQKMGKRDPSAHSLRTTCHGFHPWTLTYLCNYITVAHTESEHA